MSQTAVTIRLTPAVVNYEIERGDDFADTFTLREGDPLADADLTGRTYKAQLRRNPNASVVTDFVIDASDAANGTIGYAIPNAVTDDLSGKYTWDMQQITGGKVRTLMTGFFTVKIDTTRA